MFVMTPAVILLCITIPALVYFIVKWALNKDTEIENRRRAAAKLAAKLQTMGLDKLPAFLIDYSVGDYSGMCNRIHNLCELFLSGETAVMAEFEKVFANVLDAELKTEAGRALIAAKLATAKSP